MNKDKILIVEDNQAMRELLEEVLQDEGYEVVSVETGRAAANLISDEQNIVDLVVTDVQLPELKGDELLQKIRAGRAETPVIVITAFGSIEQAVEMVKRGAFQYLTKPFSTKDLLSTVAAALQSTAAQRAQSRLRRDIPLATRLIIGSSPPLRELFELIIRAGRTNSNVLITGESGTGKELVAKAIHEASNRQGEFVPVNCPAIPIELVESELFGHTGQAFTGARAARGGLFETAEAGTIFLDEIAELPLAIQPKLLRVLQESTLRRVGADRERKIDVRVVAATNRDLEKEVAAGNFREDLFWRLNIIHLHVPPLRERSFDIPLLIEHFLQKTAASGSSLREVSQEALALLTAYQWPGNVRELENTIERAAALARSSILTPEDLPNRIRPSINPAVSTLSSAKIRKLTVQELEREYILEILRECDNNKSRAAEILGLDRKTLYRKLEEYRSDNPELQI